MTKRQLNYAIALAHDLRRVMEAEPGSTVVIDSSGRAFSSFANRYVVVKLG